MKRSTTEPRIDERLFYAYLAIMIVGLIMIYSASGVIAESRFDSNLFFIKRQLLRAVMAVVLVWFITKLDLAKAAVYSVPALILTMATLALVFLMPARNEAHRWIILGPVTIQPSEIFKYLVVVFLAFSLSNPKRDITKLGQLLVPYLPLLGLALLLIVMEPDLGSTIAIAVAIVGMFFLAGARLRHIAAAFVPLAALGSFVVFVLGYKKARILDYMAALADPLQGSYQSKQAALALGAGGLLGTGLGEGRQKLWFLPYPHTDFIFASSGEEVGLVGLLVILGLFFYILRRGLKIAWAQPDRFGYLLASGMVLTLFVNIAINLGVVTCLLPVTGLPLPFISYGGTSLLMSSAAVGVLLNLSKKAVRT
jgi:cell division protein FtsW